MIAALAAGAVVLDVRAPERFCAGHCPGSVNLLFGEADLGERAELVLPKDITLIVCADDDRVAGLAVSMLAGAGFEVLGHIEGGTGSLSAAGRPTSSLSMLEVDELHRCLGRYRVVDAREAYEFRRAHIAGAFLLPSGDAWKDAGSVPEGELAVICASGVRAAIVASVLARAGRSVALVRGGMPDWVEQGHPVETGRG